MPPLEGVLRARNAKKKTKISHLGVILVRLLETLYVLTRVIKNAISRPF